MHEREHGISEGRPAAWRRVWPDVAASVVLSPTSVHVLQGFTPHFGQYWQYTSSAASAVRNTRLEMGTAALGSHRPLWLALSLLCEGGPPRRGTLLCSRRTAAARLAPLRRSRVLGMARGPAGVHVWGAGCVTLLASWLRTTARALGTLTFVQLPAAWLVANALRHVDTPHTPYRLA